MIAFILLHISLVIIFWVLNRREICKDSWYRYELAGSNILILMACIFIPCVSIIMILILLWFNVKDSEKWEEIKDKIIDIIYFIK